MTVRRIIRSHRLERLADVLADGLRQMPFVDPIEPEWVVIPSAGMERWLSMRLADTLGIVANLRFVFPDEILRALAGLFVPEETDGASLHPDRLFWGLLDAVPRVVGREGFATLRAYLDPHVGGQVTRREVLLVRQLADVFDRYLVHRPDLLLAWERGAEPGDWQAELWRALCAQDGGGSSTQRHRLLLEAIERAQVAPPGLPRRLWVFGVSTLPPLYLEIFRALGRLADIHLLVFAPTPVWFADARSPAEAVRDVRRAGVYAVSDDDLHPLLRSFGRLSRDFQDLLADIAPLEPDGDLFEDDPECQPTLLRLLQTDIVAARIPDEKHCVRPADGSVQVHSCHGPMRQVEVLRDVLLTLLDRDRTLQPRDILVMTPDIATYAPLIEAVFGEGGTVGIPHIPYQIADRSLAGENRVAEVLARVLDLATGRVPASAVLDLLALAPVASRYGISVSDLERIRVFIRQAGIRWGLHADHRVAHGLPRSDEYTWRFGLDRLLLGVAMESRQGTRIFADVVPCDAAVTGVETLRRFVSFAEDVMSLIEEARLARLATDWVSWTKGVMDVLVSRTSEDEASILEVLRVLEEWRRGVASSRLLDLDAWRAVFEGLKAERRGAGVFFRGGVTFAALVPLRSIPFRVIALIGMDDRAFPRPRSAPSFDRTVLEPRRGDRNPRDEDLQMFLQAILSARDTLVITYTGRGMRDNEVLPPAVPVGQLLDAIRSSFEVEGVGDAAEAVVYDHPLQPFSPKNYREPWRSYDARFAAVARALVEPRRSRPPALLDSPISEGEPLDVVTPAELARFLEHPVRAFLRSRCRLEVEEVTVEDQVPATLAGLDRWSVGEGLLRAMLSGEEEISSLLRRYRRSGYLPPGRVSEAEFEVIAAEVRGLVEQARRLMPGEARSESIMLSLGGVRLAGTVEGLYGDRIVWACFSTSTHRHLIRMWVHHLAASAALPGYAGTATLLSRGQIETLGPLDEDRAVWGEKARAILSDLLELMRLGRTTVLPFFAASSRAYTENWKEQARALEAARRAWITWDGLGEGQDPFVRFAFGDVESPNEATAPNAPSFQELSERVWRPILEVLR